MGIFKAIGKLAKRAAKSKIVKAALATNPIGQGVLAAGKAISVAKSIGAKVHANKIREEQSKADAAALLRANSKLDSLPKPGIVSTKGGDVIRIGLPGQSQGSQATPVKRRKAVKKAKAKAPKAKSSRPPPKGGKDFKALSAAWKAAGKPGTWLQWVKSH